jgi:hypothetical protein
MVGYNSMNRGSWLMSHGIGLKEGCIHLDSISKGKLTNKN